jgi:putative hydrolases of HD superfamily
MLGLITIHKNESIQLTYICIVLSTLSPQPIPNSTSPLPFLHILSRLKRTKREGWRRMGIPDGESVSDHMYRMAIMTMFAPPSLSAKLDMDRCMRMALIHDMAELLVGDITPRDGVPKVEKSRREAETMDYLCGNLLGNVVGNVGNSMRDVWQEYEDSKTLESKFVHDVDKMELLLQMLEYEQETKAEIDLSELSRVSKRVELPEMKAWSDQLLQERAEFWKSVGKKPMENGTRSMDEEQNEYYQK